jgi:hypothetical protein
MNRLTSSGLLAGLLLSGIAARGDGCAVASSSPAPDVTGPWAITYGDDIDVEINLGGTVYREKVSAEGGAVTVVYKGTPISFDIDCSRPEVLCPSESWPKTIEIEQREAKAEHQMIVTLPMQRCDGTLIDPKAESCGEGTLNPDCEQVCDGETVIEEREAFGVIGEAGESFRLYLGAGVATNGFNCAALSWSVADADLVTEEEGTEAWRATEMENGTVTLGYGGGCFWVGQVDSDPELEGVVLSASVTFTTPFTGSR